MNAFCMEILQILVWTTLLENSTPHYSDFYVWKGAVVYRSCTLSCDIWPSLAPVEPLSAQQQNTAVVLSSSQVWVCATVWMQSSWVRGKKKKDDACLAEKAWLRLKKQTAGTAVVVFVCVLLTQTVGQEVGGEALGAVAHGCVVVCVSAKHQHRPAHYHRCVEVTEEAAVSQNGPAHAHSDGCYTVRRCTAVTIRQAVCAQKWVSSVVTIPTCCCCNGFVTKESVKHRCSYLQLYNKSNK